MVRKFCIQYPNAFYHIASRGSNKQNIFLDSSDNLFFLEICNKAHFKFNLKIYAYCLMNNHYHLYVSTPDANIATSIKFINENYAKYFLKKYPNKDGHVFRGRYMRKIVQEDTYSKVLVRYIHLNPVKAGLCNKPEDWLWSSYKSFFDSGLQVDFLDYDWTLKQFGKNFKEFHEEKSALSWDPDELFLQKVFIAEQDFINEFYQKINEEKLKIKLQNLILIDYDLIERKVNSSLDKYGISKKYTENIKIFLLKQNACMTLNEIAWKLNKSPKAISKIFNKFKTEMEKNDNLRIIVEGII